MRRRAYGRRPSAGEVVHVSYGKSTRTFSLLRVTHPRHCNPTPSFGGTMPYSTSCLLFVNGNASCTANDGDDMLSRMLIEGIVIGAT